MCSIATLVPRQHVHAFTLGSQQHTLQSKAYTLLALRISASACLKCLLHMQAVPLWGCDDHGSEAATG